MSSVIFTKKQHSGSTSGRPIAVAATATPGTLIHTAVSGSDDIDETWIYATNTDSSAVLLTIELGGASASDQIVVRIPGQTQELVVPGQPMNGGVAIRAFADSANDINITGHVNLIQGNP